MTITPTNVSKIISIATGFYWVIAGLLVWNDCRSGLWLEKGGAWILVIYFTGIGGAGFWGLLAPIVSKALQGDLKPRNIRSLGKFLWCFSTLPLVLLCLVMDCLLVHDRIAT